MADAITPAMRSWCRLLAHPGAYFTRGSPLGFYRINIGHRYERMTWVMGRKLERAGLVKFKKESEWRQVGTLTDKGRATATPTIAAADRTIPEGDKHG